MDRECAKVASAPQGGANTALNEAAFAIGGFVGAGVLDRRDAEAHLAQAAAARNIPAQEAAATIKSGLDAGEKKPRDLRGLAKDCARHPREGGGKPRKARATGKSPSGRRTGDNSREGVPTRVTGNGAADAVLKASHVKSRAASYGTPPLENPTPPQGRAPDQDGKERTAAYARQILSEGQPAHGTIAETYLTKTRGLASGNALDRLRFHPAVRHSGAKRDLPAMIAPILRSLDGDPCGIHITYLAPDGGKPDVEPRKRHMATVAGEGLNGGAVWLSDRAATVVVSEGIEKSLAIAAATGLAAISGLSATILPNIAFPSEVRTVILCADHGQAGDKAIAKAGKMWTEAGLTMRVCHPPDANHDWDETTPDAIRAAIDGAAVWEPKGDNGADAKDKSKSAGDGAKERSRAGQYEAKPHGLILHKATREEGKTVEITLTNFTARIVRDVIEDDGVETRRTFEIEARLNGAAHLFDVPGSAFQGMAWVTEKMGAEAFIAPGLGAKDHARAAIQRLSGRIPKRHVYTHTGWCEIAGQWIYLHGQGAIGADGVVPDVGVSLTGALAGYELPEPPTHDALREAVRASLHILAIAPDHIAILLLATTYRAPLGVSDFTPHFAGKTGTFKSEVAALGMQHWGTGWHGKNLPANFESSAAFCQSLQFQAKDALFVVDDFIPPSGQHDAAKYDANAGKLFRGAGNNAGRGRADTTGKARTAKSPRGQSLSTGEDIPSGHSCRARMFIVGFVPGDVDAAKLKDAQRAGREGLYAAAMAGYVQWLAADYPARKAAFEKNAEARRDTLYRDFPHARTATTTGALLAAWDVMLQFAQEVRAIDALEADGLRQRADTALREVARQQSDHQMAADPVERFHDLLSAALSSGRAHVATMDGRAPHEDAGAWGWRRDGIQASWQSSWQPQGSRIGWIDDDALYLEPTAAYAAAQELAGRAGGGLGMQPATLWKRMEERGLIRTRGKPHLTIQRTIEGKRGKRVLHFSQGLLLPLESGESGDREAKSME